VAEVSGACADIGRLRLLHDQALSRVRFVVEHAHVVARAEPSARQRTALHHRRDPLALDPQLDTQAAVLVVRAGGLDVEYLAVRLLAVREDALALLRVLAREPAAGRDPGEREERERDRRAHPARRQERDGGEADEQRREGPPVRGLVGRRHRVAPA
jgi:hypothetical protein